METFQSSSLATYLPRFSRRLPHFPPLGRCVVWLMSLCRPLLRIRQAKVQILPERILPDPLAAVQLTPLSRLLVQPPVGSQSRSSNLDCRRWTNGKQVGHTKHKGLMEQQEELTASLKVQCVKWMSLIWVKMKEVQASTYCCPIKILEINVGKYRYLKITFCCRHAEEWIPGICWYY